MAETDKPGYDDTPYISSTTWRVHDCGRPAPPIVAPAGHTTQDAPGAPPSDAVVLFGGDLSGWVGKDGPAKWDVADGVMTVAPKTGNISTKECFGDCQLHVEWAAPCEVKGDSQGRGNSGVFLMGLYEIQVLDCYDNPTYADGATAGVYGQYPPLVNACRKPGEWQTYDIIWTGPRFEGNRVIRPAAVTVLHNGVLVHDHVEIKGTTTHRTTLPYEPHPPTGPLMLQDHGDLVSYRNIWYRPARDYDEA